VGVVLSVVVAIVVVVADVVVVSKRKGGKQSEDVGFTGGQSGAGKTVWRVGP